MKSTKIRGYLNDIQNKNKNFSFDRTMKILDISNYIYIDLIDKFSYQDISNYSNAKYLIKEISEEFKTIYDLIDSGKVLMGACLLRNTFEEITYIIASSIEPETDLNVMTKATYFNDIVAKNCNKVLSKSYEAKDIKSIYGYLSKITHVTNIKEAVSYLVSNIRIKKYITNEIKYVTLLIENMYLDFLYKKSNKDNSMCDNLFAVAGYSELLNVMYFSGNATKNQKKLESYFYGEKNQKFLHEQKELMIETFKDLQNSKHELSKSINKISKELDKQLINNNYFEIANEILNS